MRVKKGVHFDQIMEVKVKISIGFIELLKT